MLHFVHLSVQQLVHRHLSHPIQKDSSLCASFCCFFPYPTPLRPSSPQHPTTNPLLPWREISEELISGGMESRSSQQSWRTEIGARGSFIGQGLTEGWQWVEANHQLTTDIDNKVSLWDRGKESDR